MNFDGFVRLFGSNGLLQSLHVALVCTLLITVFRGAFKLLLTIFLRRSAQVGEFTHAVFFVPIVVSTLTMNCV